MPYHKLYSAFISFIKYEVYIRSKFCKIHVQARNTKDLISEFESAQPERLSNKQNNFIENSIYQVKPFNFQGCKFISTYTR